MFPQGAEEEEEAEHYSDEEAPAAASESKPSAVDGPTKIEEEEEKEEEAEGEGGEQEKEENKAEEKGNLAGERQSGDGQVRLAGPFYSWMTSSAHLTYCGTVWINIIHFYGCMLNDLGFTMKNTFYTTSACCLQSTIQLF